MAKTDISVQELVDKVERRELLLPEMQRKYVWSSTQVRDLLDSLYRGYPSGTILVWEPSEEVETRELSVEATNTPSTTYRQLLLDGQQRITSLTAVLTGQQIVVRNRKRPIEILFNLDHPDGVPLEAMELDENEVIMGELENGEEEENQEPDVQQELNKRTFVVGTRSLKNDPHWVSVSDIFRKSDKDILKPLGINSDDDSWDRYTNRLEKIRDIRKYMYVVQILEKSMSYEEVTEIFVRVNSSGIKLRGSDLALAQITSKWKGFMGLVEEFSETFDDDAEYIANWVAVRMLTVCATRQGKFNTIGRVPREKLEEAWIKAKHAIEFAVNFLRSNAGVDNLSYLSASMLLIPIGLYAVQNEEHISEDDRKRLIRWFYLAHMRGHYSMGSTESILNADLAILFRTNDLSELVNQLKTHVHKFEVDAADLDGKNISSPFFTMMYFVMRHKGIKDWYTGLQLSDKHLGISHKIQYHHIFPKSLLKREAYEPKIINEIANMAFIGGRTNRQVLNREPVVYLEQDVRAKFGDDALMSHLIPLDKQLWELSKYPDFLRYRREKIAEMINIFMAGLS